MIKKSDLEFISTEKNESVRFNIVDGKYEGLILEAYFSLLFDDDIVVSDIEEVWLFKIDEFKEDSIVSMNFADYDTDDLHELLDSKIDYGEAMADRQAMLIDKAHDERWD